MGGCKSKSRAYSKDPPVKSVTLIGADGTTLRRYTDISMVCTEQQYNNALRRFDKTNGDNTVVLVSPGSDYYVKNLKKNTLLVPLSSLVCKGIENSIQRESTTSYSKKFVVKDHSDAYEYCDEHCGEYQTAPSMSTQMSNVSAIKDADIIVLFKETRIPPFTISVEYHLVFA